MTTRGLPTLYALPAAEQQQLREQAGEAAFATAALEQARRAKDAHFEAAFQLVVEYAEPSQCDEAVAWAVRYLELSTGVPDALPNWDKQLRHWLSKVATQFPAELAASASKFSGGAAEVLNYCLFRAGYEPLLPRTLERLCRHFLNAAAGRYAFEQEVPARDLALTCERLLLSDRFPVLQRARVEQLAEYATAALKIGLAVNYCGQDFRRLGLELLADPGVQLASLLALFERAPPVSLEGSIVLGLGCASRINKADGLPERVRQALMLDLRSGALEDVDVTEGALRALSEVLGEDPVQELLSETLREVRTTVLIPALAGGSVVEALLLRLDAGQIEPELAETALVRSGSRMVPRLVEFGSQKKRSAVLCGVVARALGRLQDVQAAELLVTWLGHSSKGVAESARKALSQLGPGALPALTEGLHSTRKDVREGCSTLVGRFALEQPADETPLSRVAEQAASLGLPEQERFLRLCERLNDSPQKWAAQLRPALLRLGAVAVHWLREWFAEHVPRHDSRLWCYVVTLLKQDAAAVWVACDSFARLPTVPTSAWSGPRDALALAGPRLAEPVTHVLSRINSEHREPLFKLLAKNVAPTAEPLLQAGLLDPRKSIRGHSVDGLSRLPGADAAVVGQMLTSAAQGTRRSAAELLAVWGQAETAPAIALALETERHAQVRLYLEEALVACGGIDVLLRSNHVDESGASDRDSLALSTEPDLPGLSDATSSDLHAPPMSASELGAQVATRETLAAQALQLELPEAAELIAFERAVEVFLVARPRPRLARFVDVATLPELFYRSGAPVSEGATLGFLTVVSHLDFTWKGRLLRALKPAFDLTALSEWSSVLHQRWSRAKDSRQRWAVLQLWLLANDATIAEVAAGIGRLRSTEHIAAASYLKVLEWRASAESISWLFHWWNALRSRGLRATARELLGRVALRQQVSFEVLCSKINVWTHDEFKERTTTQRDEVLKALEASLTTARRFSFGLLSDWQTRFPGVLDGLLFVNTGRDVPRVGLGVALCFREAQLETVRGRHVKANREAELLLCHPLRLNAGQLLAWRKYLDACKLTPAVRQLERETYCYGGELDLCLATLNTDTKRLEAWRRGEHWLHGLPVDAGLVLNNSRRVGSLGVVACLEHSGYTIGSHEDADPVNVTQLHFEDLQGNALDPQTLDAVCYSELCLSVSKITTELDSKF